MGGGGRGYLGEFLLLPYTECKYGGSLGRPGSSCAKARLVRPREFVLTARLSDSVDLYGFLRVVTCLRAIKEEI